MTRNQLSAKNNPEDPLGRALEEVAAIGVRPVSERDPAAVSFGVFAGRSNPRYWLIPFMNKKISVSGFALYQPYTAGPRFFKRAAVLLIQLGIYPLLKRRRIHLSRSDFFDSFFPGTDISFALFTGTEGPHRKTTLQLMDSTGTIMGYVKISGEKNVKTFIINEKDALDYLFSISLDSVHVPRPIFCGMSRGAGLLITDTKKTVASKSPGDLTEKHLFFLKELAAKTGTGEILEQSRFLMDLLNRFHEKRSALPHNWQERLDRTIHSVINFCTGKEIRMIFGHGDFVPWNTFFVGEKLYVFDWEHSLFSCPPGYDLLHFLIQKAIHIDRIDAPNYMARVVKYKNVLQELCSLAGSEAVPFVILLQAYLADISTKCLMTNDFGSYVKGPVGNMHAELMERAWDL